LRLIEKELPVRIARETPPIIAKIRSRLKDAPFVNNVTEKRPLGRESNRRKFLPTVILGLFGIALGARGQQPTNTVAQVIVPAAKKENIPALLGLLRQNLAANTKAEVYKAIYTVLADWQNPMHPVNDKAIIESIFKQFIEAVNKEVNENLRAYIVDTLRWFLTHGYASEIFPIFVRILEKKGAAVDGDGIRSTVINGFEEYLESSATDAKSREIALTAIKAVAENNDEGDLIRHNAQRIAKKYGVIFNLPAKDLPRVPRNRILQPVSPRRGQSTLPVLLAVSLIASLSLAVFLAQLQPWLVGMGLSLFLGMNVQYLTSLADAGSEDFLEPGEKNWHPGCPDKIIPINEQFAALRTLRIGADGSGGLNLTAYRNFLVNLGLIKAKNVLIGVTADANGKYVLNHQSQRKIELAKALAYGVGLHEYGHVEVSADGRMIINPDECTANQKRGNNNIYANTAAVIW